MGQEREAELADVPTMIESGFPGCRSASGRACGRPPARPPPSSPELNRAANTELRTPEMKTQMARLGVAPSPARRRISAHSSPTSAKWTDIVKASGTQIE